MAYDISLAGKLKALLKDFPVTEKKMFGGTAFLLNGNMLCGVIGEAMIARVGVEKYQESLQKRGVKPFDMTGHPMAGWVEVLPGGLQNTHEIQDWIDLCLGFVKSLPAK
jgi:hypothetical protein